MLLLQRLGHSQPDPDLWGYMAFGREFWRGEGFPWRDVFAYTPTRPRWIYHEWLTGALFEPLYSASPALLQAVKHALALGAAWLAWAWNRSLGAGAFLAALVCVSPFFSFGYSPVRAQAFTNLFFLAVIALLCREQWLTRWRWWLVPLFAVWANLHGGFVAGLGMLGLGCVARGVAGRPWKPLAGTAACCAAMALVNPYGLDYITYLLEALTMPRPEITEWHSVLQAWTLGHSRENSLAFLALGGLAALLWGGCAAARRVPSLESTAILALTLLLGLKHLRHQAFFFLSCLLFLPGMLHALWTSDRLPEAVRRRWGRLLPWLGLLLGLGMALHFGSRLAGMRPWELEARSPAMGAPVRDQAYPVEAMRWLRERNATGDLLTEFRWGEYAMWLLHPAMRVAFDGRYETVYTPETAALFFRCINGRAGWEELLRRLPPDYILIRSDSLLRHQLRGLPDWETVHADDFATLLRARGAAAGETR